MIKHSSVLLITKTSNKHYSDQHYKTLLKLKKKRIRNIYMAGLEKAVNPCGKVSFL